jgi:Ni/Fe-hydrogenase subunit HybB-like protein
MVVFESILASKWLKRKPEMHLLSPLSKFVPVLLLIYLACKVSDIAIRGVEPYLFEASVASYMFHAELWIGIVIPLLMLLSKKMRRNPVTLFIACSAVITGIVINRTNVFLTAYTPVYQVEPYFPSIWEILVTVGLISTLILVYRVITIYFPVLPKPEHKPSA